MSEKKTCSENFKEPESIEEFVRQIYCNQRDVVIPTMIDLKKCVFGNGEKGLKERVIILESDKKNKIRLVDILLSLAVIILMIVDIAKGIK